MFLLSWGNQNEDSRIRAHDSWGIRIDTFDTKNKLVKHWQDN